LADATSPNSLPATALLETVLRLFPSHLETIYFRYLFLGTLRPLRSLAPTLHSLASARNVLFTLTPSYDIYLPRPRLFTSGQLPSDDLDANCDQLREILQYCQRQAEAFERRGMESPWFG
jgi:hypothetical protein